MTDRDVHPLHDLPDRPATLGIAARAPIIEAILARRSMSPRSLVAPGPSDEELRGMIACAITAPDHCGLHPVRFIRLDARERLADLFEAADREVGVDDPALISRSREKAGNAPLVIAVVACITRDHPEVPVSEQLVSVGAAVEALLLAVEAFGYGAMLTSGHKVRSNALRLGLGLAASEGLVGFVSVGTRTRPSSPRDRGSAEDRVSIWT